MDVTQLFSLGQVGDLLGSVDVVELTALYWLPVLPGCGRLRGLRRMKIPKELPVARKSQ